MNSHRFIEEENALLKERIRVLEESVKAYEHGLGEIERYHDCSKDIDCVVCTELCSIPQWIEFKDKETL